MQPTTDANATSDIPCKEGGAQLTNHADGECTTIGLTHTLSALSNPSDTQPGSDSHTPIGPLGHSLHATTTTSDIPSEEGGGQLTNLTNGERTAAGLSRTLSTLSDLPDARVGSALA